MDAVTTRLPESKLAIGLDLPDEQIAADLRDGLQRVERLLLQTCASDQPVLNESADHLAVAGGKRFRPMLVLLAAQFGEAGRADIDRAAVVIELTHLATLYHDDVMDEADVRRGAPSANARWDNSIAILTGDFLFARASLLVAQLGTEAVRIQAETFERLVIGQIRETVQPPAGVDPIEHHLQVLAEKTGSLIATAGRFGAMFAGCSAEVENALRQFGESIGMAFQLSDDLIDITSDSDDLGKATGTDLREGVRTLPMLFALASPDTDPQLVALLNAGPLTDPATHAQALALLRESEAMTAARSVLTRFVEDARTQLKSLPACAARDCLDALVDYMLARST